MGASKNPQGLSRPVMRLKKYIKITNKYLCTTHCTNPLVVITYEKKTVHESNNSDTYKHI